MTAEQAVEQSALDCKHVTTFAERRCRFLEFVKLRCQLHPAQLRGHSAVKEYIPTVGR